MKKQMTKKELLKLIAEWENDLWWAEAKGWGEAASECVDVLYRLYAQLKALN